MLLGLMGFVARRNLTQVYPVVVVWLGIIAKEYIASMQSLLKPAKFRMTIGVVLIVVSALSFSLWQTTQALPQMLFADQIYAEHFDQVSQVLHQKAKAGSRVFMLIGLTHSF